MKYPKPPKNWRDFEDDWEQETPRYMAIFLLQSILDCDESDMDDIALATAIETEDEQKHINSEIDNPETALDEHDRNFMLEHCTTNHNIFRFIKDAALQHAYRVIHEKYPNLDA